MQSSKILWSYETLKYNDAWFELGILTEEVVELQKQKWFEKNSDQNTEHYRYSA